MEKVFEIYIQTTPERLWEAITDPEIRSKYNFGARVDVRLDARARASRWAHRDAPGRCSARARSSRSTRRAGSCRRMVALWSDDVKGEGTSRVTWEIEPVGDSCRLTVTHDQLREGANDQLYGGWPMILSGLKTWLETRRAAHHARLAHVPVVAPGSRSATDEFGRLTPSALEGRRDKHAAEGHADHGDVRADPRRRFRLVVLAPRRAGAARRAVTTSSRSTCRATTTPPGFAEYADTVVDAIGDRTDLVARRAVAGRIHRAAGVRAGAGRPDGPGRGDGAARRASRPATGGPTPAGQQARAGRRATVDRRTATSTRSRRSSTTCRPT